MTQAGTPEIATGEGGSSRAAAVVGWREWVGLPDLGIARIKAKVDTGARTSALHAFNIHYIARHGKVWARFDVHPLQRDGKTVVHCEAPLIEERYVTDSGGKRTLRPVIETRIGVGDSVHVVEVTLITRDAMGFRMLLGRQAIRDRFLVDSSRSYLARRSSPVSRKKKKKKKSKLTKKRAKKSESGADV
jgi:hypothetical protein